MSGYNVQTTVLKIGGRDYSVRTLSDKQQFSDPDGRAERAGIGSATWPMFGVIWPAGRALAEEMSRFPCAGKRILEIGCGIGLGSLVLQSRGADVTASDHHPLADEFLQANAQLNALAPVKFATIAWEAPDPGLGLFDLIIGSDILYERDHPALVAKFLLAVAKPAAEIVIADPGRGRCGQLSRRLAEAGFEHRDEHRAFEEKETAPFRGRLIFYRRSATRERA